MTWHTVAKISKYRFRFQRGVVLRRGVDVVHSVDARSSDSKNCETELGFPDAGIQNVLLNRTVKMVGPARIFLLGANEFKLETWPLDPRSARSVL